MSWGRRILERIGKMHPEEQQPFLRGQIHHNLMACIRSRAASGVCFVSTIMIIAMVLDRDIRRE